MEQGETGEMTLLLHLFFEFFKVGLFAVGGGLATLPFLYALSAKTGWFTPADIADMIAVSESTPGAIGLNMATFAGYLTGGVPGAVIATVGLTVPSIIVILLIANRQARLLRPAPRLDSAYRGFGRERRRSHYAAPRELRRRRDERDSVESRHIRRRPVCRAGKAQMEPDRIYLHIRGGWRDIQDGFIKSTQNPHATVLFHTEIPHITFL